MGFAIAVVIIVGFLVSVWRNLPTDVDATTGGHWSPETPTAVHGAPTADPADVETTVDAPDEGETDPDPLDESAPYDSRRCWGCEKRCTYRAFRLPEGGTRDEIHRRAEILFRAEHGCASDLDQIDGSDVARVSLSAEELDFDPIAVAKAVGESKRRAWFELCETCVDDLRARRDNPPAPTMEPAAVVAEEACPF